jgi:hypothetical protein
MKRTMKKSRVMVLLWCLTTPMISSFRPTIGSSRRGRGRLRSHDDKDTHVSSRLDDERVVVSILKQELAFQKAMAKETQNGSTNVPSVSNREEGNQEEETEIGSLYTPWKVPWAVKNKDKTGENNDNIKVAPTLLFADSSNSNQEEDLSGDEALRLISSEVGVRQFLGNVLGPTTTTTTTETSQFPMLLLMERTLDTIEDVVLHLRRMPYDFGWWQQPSHDPRTKKKTIVVLGSGWAAHAFMKIADSFMFRVIVVSPLNHFVFTPMLASAAVGTVEYRRCVRKDTSRCRSG